MCKNKINKFKKYKSLHEPFLSKKKNIYIYIYVSKVGDLSRGWPEGSLFDSWGVGEGATSFPRLLHFTLDMYLILLSVKQRGIKYHF